MVAVIEFQLFMLVGYSFHSLEITYFMVFAFFRLELFKKGNFPDGAKFSLDRTILYLPLGHYDLKVKSLRK